LARNKVKTKKLILRILTLANKGGEGHVPSYLSILDILDTLYANFITKNKLNKFILSKGHGCLSFYAVLEKYNIVKNLNSFCSFNSNFGGHPDKNKIKGVESSTGSLGHGFPFACGISMAKKIKKEKGKVFVLIGDGECNEGTIWETFLLGSHHKLDNLICIIDKNKSTDRALMIDDLKKKIRSFNWDCFVINGHNKKMLIESIKKQRGKPLAIIANTIKGKGVSFMENNPEWHHKKIDSETIKKFKLIKNK
jgi:transketolase